MPPIVMVNVFDMEAAIIKKLKLEAAAAGARDIPAKTYEPKGILRLTFSAGYCEAGEGLPFSDAMKGWKPLYIVDDAGHIIEDMPQYRYRWVPNQTAATAA